MSQLNPKPKPQRRPKEIDKDEWKRLLKLHKFEKEARQQGISVIAGIDEAGRGPLAGPVVAAACIIPEGIFIQGVNDSKLLTPQKRYALFEHITSDNRIQYGIGIVSHKEIDQINIYQATIQAMLEAVAKLVCEPEILFIDGLDLPHPKIPRKKIIQGDSKSHSIAAASVIAKETRDRLMVEEHQKWPQYGFDKHKGYGTEEHLKAIEKHGPCPIHRMSFSPFTPKVEK
jgi:ribonuclease HII